MNPLVLWQSDRGVSVGWAGELWGRVDEAAAAQGSVAMINRLRPLQISSHRKNGFFTMASTWFDGLGLIIT